MNVFETTLAAMIELLILAVFIVVPAIFAALGFRGRDQVVGIDLGTTFSVAAIKSSDKSINLVPDFSNGKILLPSVVSYLTDGSIVVGHDAVALRSQHPTDTIFNAKRFIGKSVNESSEYAELYPFRVGPNASAAAEGTPGADVYFHFWEGEFSKTVSPKDVAAEVVGRLRKSVEVFKGYAMHRAVICVPAKFGPNEVKATWLAFEQAGFKVMRVLEEPTAAAVAYNLHKDSGHRNILVFDLGGGTLDTSLLFSNGRSISVLGVSGDERLGGSDFDNRMRELLDSKFASSAVQQNHKIEGLKRCDQDGLGILSEEVKISLTDLESVEASCFAPDGVRTTVVTRAEFEEACQELFARAIRPIEEVLEDQMMSKDDVDDIVLVGGASRMPKIRQSLSDFFGSTQRLHTEIDPDVTVAWGAANILD